MSNIYRRAVLLAKVDETERAVVYGVVRQFARRPASDGVGPGALHHVRSILRMTDTHDLP